MSFFSMTKTVFGNLLKKPVTHRYPFEPKTYFKNTRGSISIKIEQCIFCGICQRKCPSNAIVVSREEKKWTINRFRCVVCNSCVEQCPKKCLTMENNYTQPNTKKSEEVHQNL